MSAVKTKVVRIGNSRGIRIPKVILDQCHINDEVVLEIREGCLVIKSPHKARGGWDLAFQKMHESKDDALVVSDNIANEFDKDEWEW
jgi:antitoxin MazE